MRAIRNFIIFAFVLLVMMNNYTVYAANDHIITNKDTVIEEGQKAESVVVLGNNVVIYGEVRDAVVVINGNLSIKNSADIKGVIFVIGGEIEQEPEAKIMDGNVFNIYLTHDILNSLLIGASLVVGSKLLQFSLSMILILLMMLTILLGKKHLDRFDHILIHSTKKVVLIGILSSILITALVALLTITVIGIPIAILLLMIGVIFFIIGLSTISWRIGKMVYQKEYRNIWVTSLIGTVAITSFINFPILGGFLFVLLAWVSLGIMTVWIWNRKGTSRKAKD